MGPWYGRGLRFTCTRCGACCTGEPGNVWVTDAEIAALAQLQDVTAQQFEKIYTRVMPGNRRTLREKSNGDCVFYDREAGCTVYAARPVQCRTWPFWESTAGTPESWTQTQEKCPGAGHGELIPVEEITRRMKAIKI